MTQGTPGAEPVVLVGAGLAGCLLATLLGRRGFDVTVYERRPDPRVAGAERGRSINLALSARGLAALELVGLREHALSNALPMPGRMVHPVDGKANFQPYSADGTRAINSISRSALNEALLESAEATPGVTVVFDHRLDRIDLDTGTITFSTGDGVREVQASVVLASDGAYSVARTAMPGLDVRLDHLEQGYKELTIPAVDGEFAIDPKALHIWARGRSMMIALPNQDKSFTCTLFWPKTGAGSFESLTSSAQIEEHFRRHYPDVAELMPTLVDDYEFNPIGSLVTVRAWPWTASGKGCQIALVGDAAHAIVPFFGQGANCAFEDTIEIDALLETYGPDWPRVIAAYQESRKPNTDAIAEMALENHIEMSERVNSRIFRAKSAALHALERLSGAYVSRYELVSFSTTPYSRIKSRIRKQNTVLVGAAAVLVAAVVAAWRALAG